MSRVKGTVLALSGLAIGFGLAWTLRPAQTVATDGDGIYVAKTKIADKGDQATVRALRARIAQLERELAARAVQPKLEASTNGAPGFAADGRGRPDPRRFLEELREKDPARYAQITNRMAKGWQRRAARAQSRLEYLASIDTSRMSAGAKQVHGDLQELLAAREEIEKRLQNPDLTDTERKELFDELHEMRGKVADLSRQERNNLLEETAKELGFSGNDAKEITATIKDVIEATNGGGHGPGGPGGPGGPPPAGGGGGGPR